MPPTKKKEEASSWEIHQKMSRLATPKHTYEEKTEDDEIPKVKDSALKYKPSRRIKKLAQPKYKNKTWEQKQIIKASKPVNIVKPSALKYRPTKRIVELSRPKGSHDYYEEEESVEDDKFLTTKRKR